MPLSMTPGSSIIASFRLRCRHRLRRDLSGSALPILPQSVPRGSSISGLPDSRICYGLPGCSPPLHGSDWDTPALGDFYFQASNGSVALPAAGYNYNSDWTPLLAGFSPAGMAASLAARSKRELASFGLMSAPASCGHNAGLRPGWWTVSGRGYRAVSL